MINIFLKKEKVDSLMMANIVKELAKVNFKDMENIFDQAGVVYDQTVCQLVIMTLNYEFLRHSLYKINNKKIVDESLQAGYQLFFNSLSLDSDTINRYKEIIFKSSDDFKNTLASNHFRINKNFSLIYDILLKLLDINPTLIDEIRKNEIILMLKNWFEYGNSKVSSYKIENTKESLPPKIDIDF